MKTVKVTCYGCGIEFDKVKTEYLRNQTLNRNSYCSKKCCNASVSRNNLGDYAGISTYNISLHSDNRRDEYSGFRTHLARAKRRNKDFNLTLDDLLTQWELQDGKCSYTGVKLKHPLTRTKHDAMVTASLDRIDSNKGYVRGNVQFVSMAANYAKNKMSHEQMMQFCKLIADHYKG